MVSMTEFNQSPSAVARRVVDDGVTVKVTRHGRVVLRVVPELPDDDPFETLVESGFITRSRKSGSGRRIAQGDPVPLSASIDELLEEVRGDTIV